MTRYRWLLACFALALVPGVAGADSGDDRTHYAVEWYAIGFGGGSSRQSDFQIDGTIGQTGLGLSSDGSGPVLISGFWSPGGFTWGDDDDLVANLPGATVDASPNAIAMAVTPITEFALSPVFPNPSAGAVQIAWAVPVRSRVSLMVLDVQGRLVETLADGEYQPGRYQATWNNQRPGRSSPGLYFVRFQSPERTLVRRVVITQ